MIYFFREINRTAIVIPLLGFYAKRFHYLFNELKRIRIVKNDEIRRAVRVARFDPEDPQAERVERADKRRIVNYEL